MNVKILLAYDGTHYFGWQKTKTGPSIQEALEKALLQILGSPTATEASSRTDRGVHAKKQAVNFFLDKEISLSRLLYSLNAVLPPDIRTLSLEPMPDAFHPTLHAICKEYRYFIQNHPVQDPIKRLYAWHIHAPLDLEAMRCAGSLLTGTHDFSAFTTKFFEDTIRTLSTVQILTPFMGQIEIRLIGDRFLYKMARRLVGTLVAVGKGRISPSDLAALLSSPNRAAAGMTAPAHGLFLHEVIFKDPL